jgi:hypothetical protein
MFTMYLRELTIIIIVATVSLFLLLTSSDAQPIQLTVLSRRNNNIVKIPELNGSDRISKLL